ncbi:hypothetical protein ABBQ32_14160 [Trebouxia sp. C0010 RCD-2024]
MAFNRIFFRFSDIISSPFSARKRKREQAEPLSDSFSARPSKQAQRPAQPDSSQAAAFSHQSNTRVPEIQVLTQTVPPPADQDKEASSTEQQRVPTTAGALLPSRSHTGAWSGAHKSRVHSKSHTTPLQPPDQELPSQTELDLQRRVEATERQMAELRQELKALQNNPVPHSQTVEGAQINLQEREQYGKLVELSKAQGAQHAVQRGHTQRPAADPRATGTIVLDSPAASHLPSFGHAYQSNSHQPQQGRAGGVTPQQLNNQQPVGSQASHQSRTLPRFGPDYRAPSGFSPFTARSGFSPFRATSSSARPDSMGAHGNSPSFRSPAQLRSGLASPETGNHARSLSAHPHSKLLDELMEELSMHQPYDPLAPLPLVSTTHQSTVSTADAIEMDVDAVIARAKSAKGDSQTSLNKAATQEAEMMAHHKSFMRRSQAAQSPLPPLDGKGAPTAAQARRRSAAAPSKGRKSDTYDEEEEEESALSSEQDESELSAAFSELGRLEPVHQPTKAMLKWKDKAFAPGPDSEVLVEHVHSGVDIARKDIRTLRSRQWLNDEVMNVYMGLLQERDVRMRKLGRAPKCHFFNTFFVNKLYNDDKKYVYNNVRRWTSEMRLERWGQPSKKVTECDKLIIPVHLGCHWTCAVINLRDQEILYFDSLGGKEHEIVESLAKYVTDEYQNKCQETVDTSDWPRRSPGAIPKQMNGCDCGVFALMFAEYQARDAPFTFDQRHMEYFRVKVVADIMSQSIDVPDPVS